jgi:hypothetical protein
MIPLAWMGLVRISMSAARADVWITPLLLVHRASARPRTEESEEPEEFGKIRNAYER